MRYDKRITFLLRGGKTYDESTGDYTRAEDTKTVVPASVIDTRTSTMELVYGEIRQGSLTIQLQKHYEDPFDLILYDGNEYRVDFRRKLRTKETLIVSEVQ